MGRGATLLVLWVGLACFAACSDATLSTDEQVAPTAFTQRARTDDWHGKLIILCIFGTRPEAVKLAPVIRELHAQPEFYPVVIYTGQVRESPAHLSPRRNLAEQMCH